MTIISGKTNDSMYDNNASNERYGEEIMEGLPGDLAYTFEERVCW
jgi:hypothetical protein